MTIYRLEEGRISMLGKGMSSARPWASSSGGSSFPAAAAVMWRGAAAWHPCQRPAGVGEVTEGLCARHVEAAQGSWGRGNDGGKAKPQRRRRRGRRPCFPSRGEEEEAWHRSLFEISKKLKGLTVK